VLSVGVVILAALIWLGLMFGVAIYGERRPQAFARAWPEVYALSLAVYCTSWTFFGTVTQAARYGWPLPPTFIGTILLYVFGIGLLMRLVRLVREHNSTSIADFVASRLGQDGWLAAAVTFVAVLGIVPYIALQLKAVAMSFALLVRDDAVQAPAWQDSALYVALAMAAFAMLFGTRSASAAEHNRGLILAMAFEALLKLGAMLALCIFVWRLPGAPPANELLRAQAGDLSGFAPLVVLGVLAMFTLPHQFHVGAVECRDERHVLRARWLFPLYLLLIALPLLPLARAGDALLAGRGVPSDLYVLALPLSQGNETLALLAFLGGLSAGTGMVIVSTLTLSLMIGNHWLTPLWLRGVWAPLRKGGPSSRMPAGVRSSKKMPADLPQTDLRGAVLMQRRIGILAIVLLAWGYGRLIAGNDALADVGALSFSALAALAPALGFALWRPQTPPRAVLLGIVAAVAIWVWLLLAPVLAEALMLDVHWLRDGPFGWSWFAPDAFFGLTGWSRLGRAVVLGLFSGVVATWLASTWPAAWWQASPRRVAARGLDLDTLREAGRRFLPRETVDAALLGAPASGAVPALQEARLERELAAVLGSASARLLLDAARRQVGRDFDTVAAIVGEASQDLRFNQRLLEAALENMSQGISVVDRDLRLVAWNRRYAEVFDYPESLLRVGVPVAELVRHNLRGHNLRSQNLRSGSNADSIENEVEKRLRHMHAGTPYVSERVFADGSVVEIRGNPMPGGGFVATFTDVTAFRRAEAELIRSNETLEQRVADRTARLDQARAEAERANDAKSRFLAAIGHDLLQPLHAAQLFTDALAEQLNDHAQRGQAQRIRGALDSTGDLLTGMVAQPRAFPLADVLDPLASEFRALTAECGLVFRYRRSRVWVRTDPQLLRRVLQNFLANAVRYTERGGVLLGVRRDGAGVRIEVHDTGPGIPESQRCAIFEEFRRGDGAAGQGLGLGLAIADRIARLLEAPLALRSRIGRGTVFALTVAHAEAMFDGARAEYPMEVSASGLAGLRVLIVDNDPQALAALATLLRGWGCEVDAFGDAASAERLLADGAVPALWLFDYHLSDQRPDGGDRDDEDTGIALYERLRGAYDAQPTLILSADGGGDVRRMALEHGLGLLPKPVKALALKSMLRRLLTAVGGLSGPIKRSADLPSQSNID
jgi:signal transduction histidine kinase/Na+/proline symporter/CheY-like chemotaxis protein